MSQLTIVFAFFGTLALVTAYVIYLVRRSQEMVLKQSRGRGSLPSDTISGKIIRGDRTYHWAYEPPRRSGKHTIPSKLTLHSSEPGGLALFLAPESTADLWLRNLGVSAEFVVGDSRFDHSVHLSGSDPQAIRRIIVEFLRDHTKAGLFESFGIPLHVGITPNGCTAEFKSPIPHGAFEECVGKFVDAFDVLVTLSNREAQGRSRPRAIEVARRYEGWRNLHKSLGASAYIFGALLLVFAHLFFEPLHFLDAYFIGGSVLLALVVAAAFVFRKRIAQALLPASILLGPLLAALIFSWTALGAGALYVNARFDKSGEIVKEMPITSKQLVRSRKGGRSYYVYISSPDRAKLPFQETVRLSVSRSTFDAVNPGSSKVVLSYHDGALGIPWIREYAVKHW